MLGLFGTPNSRVLKKRKALLKRAKLASEKRKMEFRENAISKLSFLYPDIKFAVSMQSPEFVAFSPEKNELLAGRFLDDYLPSLFDLEEKLENDRFESFFQEFLSEVKNYVPQRHAKGYMDRNSKDAQVGYWTVRNAITAFEIQLRKNDRVVARTSRFYPKSTGYLAEKVYENVVQDLTGNGVSKFTIDLGITGFGGGGVCFRSETHYFYPDFPRKSENQSRDHYLQVCSQFLPFLNALEVHVLDTSDLEYMDIGEDPEGLSDADIGLK